MKTKKIFSRKLALELRKCGCRIIKTEPNTYKPEFNVYIFEDNDRLQKTFTEVVDRLLREDRKTK